MRPQANIKLVQEQVQKKSMDTEASMLKKIKIIGAITHDYFEQLLLLLLLAR